MNNPDSILLPDWPAPATVGALCTTRIGGFSEAPFASNNLALHVGDNPERVARNRQQLADLCDWGTTPQWLEQIHGVKVVRAKSDGLVRTADACYTDAAKLPCAVLTADCLPVLVCDLAGKEVAAIHAGWRSLARGILPRAIDRFSASASSLMAWLGPAIGPQRFEVGVDVLEAFFKHAKNDSHTDAIAAAMRPAKRPLHFYADLYALARASLSASGVSRVYGGGWCTYEDQQRFYSYRRDGKNTGRMASVIWRR